jgi:xylan 1,4-beta-xylosidase
MVVYGLANWSMPNPALTNFEDRFQRASIGTGYSNLNGGTWGISNNFLTQSTKGSTAFYIDYENTFTTASNYGVAILNGNANRLETTLLVNGVWDTQVNTPLPTGFDISKLHTIRVEKSGSSYKYYVDKMLKETKISTRLGAGKVGYLTCDDAAKFGYIAVSNKVNGKRHL